MVGVEGVCVLRRGCAETLNGAHVQERKRDNCHLVLSSRGASHRAQTRTSIVWVRFQSGPSAMRFLTVRLRVTSTQPPFAGRRRKRQNHRPQVFPKTAQYVPICAVAVAFPSNLVGAYGGPDQLTLHQTLAAVFAMCEEGFMTARRSHSRVTADGRGLDSAGTFLGSLYRSS